VSTKTILFLVAQEYPYIGNFQIWRKCGSCWFNGKNKTRDKTPESTL